MRQDTPKQLKLHGVTFEEEFRKPLLYPSELQARTENHNIRRCFRTPGVWRRSSARTYKESQRAGGFPLEPDLWIPAFAGMTAPSSARVWQMTPAPWLQRPMRKYARRVTNEGMDKVIREYPSLDALKADEYRDWQALPPDERMNAVAELSLAAYQMKEPSSDVRRLQKTLVHLQRPES